MITKYKIFESVGEPQVGDYVMCNGRITSSDEANEILMNNIGKITHINSKYDRFPLYTIRYNNIPRHIMGHFSYGREENVRKVNIGEIKHFDKSKEELEIKIQTSKYNL